MRVFVLMVALLLVSSCSSSSSDVAQDLQPDSRFTEVWMDVLTPPDSDDAHDRSPDLPGEAETLPEIQADVEPELPGCPDEIPAHTLAGVADPTFDLGPYLMDAQPDSVVVMWRTLEPCIGVVLWGPGDDSLDLSLTQSSASLVHELLVQDLQPATRYAYQVVCADQQSQVHHFQTAPMPGHPFRFVGWGDNQSGPEIFTGLVEQMIERKPDIAIGVGDHVSAGSQPELWKLQLMDPARPLFHEVPFYAAMGNHEQNGVDYYELFSYPVPDDAGDPFHESYYSYTYGNTFFIVVNTNTIFIPVGEIDTPVSAWIRQQAQSQAAMDATWRIAYAHEPGYTENWSDGSCNFDGSAGVDNFLLPVLANNNFHVFFAGHTHAYERGMRDGLVQVITGGGGGGLDTKCFDVPETTVIYQEHHFVSVDAGCDTLRLEAIDRNGLLFDWFELSADQPGTYVDEGPIDGLPEPVMNPGIEPPEQE